MRYAEIVKKKKPQRIEGVIVADKHVVVTSHKKKLVLHKNKILDYRNMDW